MKMPPLRLVAILLLVSPCLGQSDDSAAARSPVHVQGMVNGPFGYDVCPGTEITFTNEHISKITTSEGNGSYQLDLPAGLYTMTARYQILIGKTPYYMKQSRPLFRASSSPVVLNMTMFEERLTCDIVVVDRSGGPATSEQSQEASKDLCGSEDQFPVPADDGTPYQLFIKYPRRSPKSREYEYSGDQLRDKHIYARRGRIQPLHVNS